jgi:outer membrane cobalamin receptor
LSIGKFYANANITMLDGELTFNPDEIDAKHTGGHHVQLFNYGSFVTSEIKIDKLVRRPQFTSNAEVGFKPTNEVTLTTAYRYVGSRFDSAYDPMLGPYGALGQISIKRYHLFDVGASFQLTKALLFGFKIENVFNERFEEIGGFQTRGRTGNLNLLIKW